MNASQTSPIHAVLGTGPAGSTLVAELARRGHNARSIDRRGNGPDLPGVERVQADLADPDQARDAIHGADVVYHCVNVAYHLQVDLMPRLSESILAAVQATGARLIVLDTLYPYGEADSAAITEQTPWTATSRKGRLRAALDTHYLQAHQDGVVRVALGRSADFFGPGVLNSTLGGAIFPAALTGGPVLGIGDIDLPHSYTFIEDVARGLATLGEQPTGDGKVWHLPTVPALTTRQVFAMIEAKLGVPLTIETVAEPRPWGPYDETFMTEYAEMFYQHLIPQNVVSTAFESAFNVQPTPISDALDATIAWYRAWLVNQQAS